MTYFMKCSTFRFAVMMLIFMTVLSVSSVRSEPLHVRQVYSGETTQQDCQHLVSPGRQIVYAGYYDAGCDYVYMNYVYSYVTLSGRFYNIRFGEYDWGAGDWDYSHGGIVTMAHSDAFSPNIDAEPKNGWPVFSNDYLSGTTNLWKPEIGYGQTCFPGVITSDILPGAPNSSSIRTGFCFEDDPLISPYVYPRVDIDTTASGASITHVTAVEEPLCAYPTGTIETRSLVYYRKISTTGGYPNGGTWEEPAFIDSVYLPGAIVRADKRPGHPEVYIAYLRPINYFYGTPLESGDLDKYYNNNDVVYRRSNDDGASWLPPIHVTDYLSAYDQGAEPAAYDLSALIDPNGNFHLVWTSIDRNPDNTESEYMTGKLWHWDSGNDCISLVYDAGEPSQFTSSVCFGKWNTAASKPNISWCDDKLYVSFTRFGIHTNPEDPDAAFDYGANGYLNGDIMVVCSDADGEMGKIWSDAINLTDTETNDCEIGDCKSEHWATMAMYSTDSLMIQYILDEEPGAYGIDNATTYTDNPVMFMTWPCFSMADVGKSKSASYRTVPDMNQENVVKQYTAVSPFANPGCVNPQLSEGKVDIINTGNVNLSYTSTSINTWLTVIGGASGSLSAGTGPIGAANPAWTGKSGCASPAEIKWLVNSDDLDTGYHVGQIRIDFDQADDLTIEVGVYVSCVAQYAWTLMFYMNGDNSMEASVMRDINELEKAASSKVVQAVALVDRIPGNDGSNGNWSDTRMYRIIHDNNINSISSEWIPFTLDKMDELNMGDPATLSGFVERCSELFPADRYALIIKDTGDGWRANAEGFDFGKDVGYDNTDHDFLGVVDNELENALTAIKATLGKKLEFLFFDVNLMQSWEIMHITSNFTKYQVGSESTINPDIIQYDKILQTVTKNPDILTSTFANSICEAHDPNDTSKHTFSNIYLENFGTFNNKFSAFVDKLRTCMTNSDFKARVDTIRARLATEEREYGDTDNRFIDLYYFVNEIKSDSQLHPVIGTSDQELLDAVIDVKKKIHNGGYHFGWSHGVSIYYPNLNDSYNAQYNNLKSSTAYYWDEYLLGDYTSHDCQGKCGDPNNDTKVNVSDAVYLINFVFSGGNPPKPVLACGDANSDARVNVSDAVWLINYVFSGGNSPYKCSPGASEWQGEGGDCCEFVQ